MPWPKIQNTQGPFSFTATSYVPPSYPAFWPASFAVVPAVSNKATPATYDWNFGDVTPHDANQYATHIYQLPGTYIRTMVATVSGNNTDAGLINAGNPVVLNIAAVGNSVTVFWPNTTVDTLVEGTRTPGPAGQWTWIANPPTTNSAQLQVALPMSANEFFRVRRPW